MEYYIPMSFHHENTKNKWFDKSCKESYEQKQKAFNAKNKYLNAKTKEAYRKARKISNSKIKQAKRAFVKGIASKIDSSPKSSKSFWNLTKQVQNNFTTTSYPPLAKGTGEMVVDSSEKAEMFAGFFADCSTLNDKGKMFSNQTNIVSRTTLCFPQMCRM